MNRAIAFLAIVGVVAACAWPALAGDAPVLNLGSRVRVTYHEPGSEANSPSVITGNLYFLNATSIMVKTARGEPGVELSRGGVSGLEVSMRRSDRVDSVLMGAGIAAAAGFGLGLLTGHDDPGTFQLSTGTSAFVLTLLLAPVGALFGMVSGSGEEWHPVPTDPIRLGLQPTVDGGGRLEASVQF